jgi:hypothetical protein
VQNIIKFVYISKAKRHEPAADAIISSTLQNSKFVANRRGAEGAARVPFAACGVLARADGSGLE